jgi:hypothetical protein
MVDLGRPIAYLALKEGTPVHDPDGTEIGVVEHVLADEPLDIFHGLIVHTLPLPGRHLYADADQIAGMYERGVVLAVSRNELREPTEPEPRREDDKTPENPLQTRLRHAWDWLREHI